MKKCLVLMTVSILLSSGALAQDKQEGLKKPKPKVQVTGREAEIWDAFNDRVNNQIDSWYKDGEFVKIIQVITLQYELYPDSYEIATNLGWMLENVELNDMGIAVYKRYAKENPSDPDGLMPLAQHYFMKRKFDQIPPILAPAVVTRRGQHPNMYRMLAISYERIKKYKESIAIWEQYLKIAPTDGQAKVNLDRVKKKLAG